MFGEPRTTVYYVKVRGFQPPYHRVAVYTCPNGHTTRLRADWRSPAPRGSIRCSHERAGCPALLTLGLPGPDRGVER